MLNATLLQRHLRTGRHDQLVKALSDNGLDIPLPLQVRLSQRPAAVEALGLRRLLEFVYAPVGPAAAVLEHLLQAQGPDGSFEGDPLATACAVSALAESLHDAPADADPQWRSAIESAIERALSALASLQDDDGLFRFADDRTQQDRALVAAFVLFMLERDEAFRGSIRYADLQDWFERHDADLEPATRQLWMRAQAGAPTHPIRHSPAVAAIAA